MKVVLTADEVTFRYLPPLPKRLMPPLLRGSKYPPYGLRKVEAATSWRVLPPREALREVNRGRVDAVGIYVNDPKGLSSVSASLRALLGKLGQEESFGELREAIREAKRRSNVKVFVGGPGAWELEGESWVDLVIKGDAENLREETLEAKGTVNLGRADEFIPVRAPSGMAEVEVMRGERVVDEGVIEREMEIQARAHGRVNLIAQDLFAHPDLLDLLVKARRYGRVRFSNVTVESSLRVDLTKVKEALGLNERNFATPVLSSGKGSCVLKEVEVIRELNRAFIYPTVFVDEGTLDEVGKYKAIVFPIAREDPAGAFLKAWRLNSRLLRRPYDRLVERVLEKNKESGGELLRRKGLAWVVLSALRPSFSSHVGGTYVTETER